MRIVTKGATFAKLAAELEEMGDDVHSAFIGVTCDASSGTVETAKGPKPESRTQGHNITIFRQQAKAGRKVNFYTPDERTHVDAMYNHAFAEFARTGNREVFVEAAKDIGRYAVRTVRRHIDKGIAKGGMKPLQGGKPVLTKDGKWITVSGYAKRKERFYPGKPILRKTDQLYKSLYAEVLLVGGKRRITAKVKV
jgi:hypothetical protein